MRAVGTWCPTALPRPHCHLPQTALLTGPPGSFSLRPPSPQSRSTSACTLTPSVAWAGPAHHARPRQPRLQPITQTASGLIVPARWGWREGVQSSRAEARPLLGDRAVGREKNAQKPCEMAVDTRKGKGEGRAWAPPMTEKAACACCALCIHCVYTPAGAAALCATVYTCVHLCVLTWVVHWLF